MPVPGDVRLGTHPGHVRVVELEGRALGSDTGQFGEVVPRRRAAGRLFQGVAGAPLVVHHDGSAVRKLRNTFHIK